MGKAWPFAEPEQDLDCLEHQLNLEDKGLFLKAWGLKEELLTDEEILMAIKLGHL